MKYTNLLAFFADSTSGLARPRIVAEHVKVTVARKAHPAELHVVSLLHGFLGSIWPDGELRLRREIDETELTELAAIDASPHKTLALIGQKVGYCCFCTRQLTDLRSVRAGYGPVCADRWGLPWGEESTAERAERITQELQRMEREVG